MLRPTFSSFKTGDILIRRDGSTATVTVPPYRNDAWRDVAEGSVLEDSGLVQRICLWDDMIRNSFCQNKVSKKSSDIIAFILAEEYDGANSPIYNVGE